MNLHEDLADIKYVFCDKTGTLTQNELVFREMTILLSTSEKEATVITAPDGNCKKLRGVLKHNDLEFDANIEHFFRCVSLNHDCIVVSYDEDKDL